MLLQDSFFTLDLKLLDQELAKVDIAERLFIDRKFIPIEEVRYSLKFAVIKRYFTKNGVFMIISIMAQHTFFKIAQVPL
jgi:hypothetical protein